MSWRTWTFLRMERHQRHYRTAVNMVTNSSDSNRNNCPALRYVCSVTLLLLCVGMRHDILITDSCRARYVRSWAWEGRGTRRLEQTAKWGALWLFGWANQEAQLLNWSAARDWRKCIKYGIVPFRWTRPPDQYRPLQLGYARRGRTEGPTRFWWETLKEKDYLQDVGVDGRIIFKIHLKESGEEGREMDWSGLGQGQVAGSCEHGDGPSGTIKSAGCFE